MIWRFTEVFISYSIKVVDLLGEWYVRLAQWQTEQEKQAANEVEKREERVTQPYEVKCS